MQAWLRANGLRVLAHTGALIPLGVMVADYMLDRLTVNPIQELTLRTGKVALVLLVLSLACTPLNTVFGWREALRVRRALGLYGFLYVVLHVLVFTVLDYVGDLVLIAQTVIEKYYIVAGLAAFVLLVPLAVTSTRGWQRRLGQRWRALHRLVYLAVPLGVLHFALLVKSLIGRPEPLLWGALVLGLLALRIPATRRAVVRWRTRLRRDITIRRQDGQP